VTQAPALEVRSGHRSGHVAGNYRLLGLLGEGGMGEVYEAVHVTVGRKFAVKLLRSPHCADGHASSRFEREARVVGALECEQIVSVLDFGRLEDTTPYLVMERLRGDDLKSVLRVAGQLPLARTLALALDVCRGLDAAHRAGLIHRDLKPANLFLCQRSNGSQLCKILDFGIARQAGATTSATANVMGTARYMAPEQILNGGSVTPATDLYALGAIMYECLSGKRLHDGDSIEAVLFGVIHDEPTPLGQLVPHLPARVGQIVAKLIRKRPEERFQSAIEVYAALRPLLTLGERDAGKVDAADSTDSTLDSELELTGGPVSYNAMPSARAPWLRALGAFAAVAVIATVGVTGYFWGQRSSPPSSPARSAAPRVVLACPAPTPTLAQLPAPSVLPTSVQFDVAPVGVRSPRPAEATKPRTSAAKATLAPSAPSSSPANQLFVAQSPYQDKPSLVSSGDVP
jgi:eukaryotic-like serine/threonine-protein kinase